MAKPIEIPVTAPGAEQAKRDIDGVADSIRKVGDATSQTSQKSVGALESLSNAWSSLRGMIGVTFLMAIAAAAVKLAQFFDQIKTRSDEAVRNLQAVRAEFTGIFEAMGAVSEGARRATVAQVTGLMKETGVGKEVAYPVIETFARKFQGKIPQADYDRSLKEMLGYAARHGTTATTQMIGMMPAFGIQTAEQMGEFRRMVTAGAETAGLKEEEITGALQTGMPMIKAMGWSPQQAITTLANLSKGTGGTERFSQLLMAMSNPQEAKFKQYGLTPALAQDPQVVFEAVQKKAATMDLKGALSMLQDIYGPRAAAGMMQLMGPMAPLFPAGIETEQMEEAARKTTQEGVAAQTGAKVIELKQKLSPEAFYTEEMRKIGAGYQTLYRDKRPFRQWMSEFLTIGTEAEKEEAAKIAWWESLSKEEQQKITEEAQQYGPNVERQAFGWQKMTPQQQYEALQNIPAEPATPAPVNIHYHNDIHFHPQMSENPIGPPVPRDIE